MSTMFNDEIRKQLKEIFNDLQDNVKIVFFKKKEQCLACPEVEEFLQEIEGLSDKIKLETLVLEDNKELAEKYNIEQAPGFVMLDKDGKFTGVKFYGLPGGHEINSFIYALMSVSGKKEELPEDIKEELSKLKNKVNIKVFVTTG
ncbi:MAG: hypothetical protein QMB63_06910 [Clostridiaceae bacterium]